MKALKDQLFLKASGNPIKLLATNAQLKLQYSFQQLTGKTRRTVRMVQRIHLRKITDRDGGGPFCRFYRRPRTNFGGPDEGYAAPRAHAESGIR